MKPQKCMHNYVLPSADGRATTMVLNLPCRRCISLPLTLPLASKHRHQFAQIGQVMKHPEAAQHPSLDSYGLRISGPVLPIVLAAWFLSTRLQPGRHLLRFSITGNQLRIFLVVTHSLTYCWSIWNIIHQEEQHSAIPTNNHASILIEFIVLTWGEAALQDSDFWPYTLTSMGWIMLAFQSLSDATFPSSSNIWLSLLLSLPCAFQMSARVGSGAMLSGLSLLSNAIFALVNARDVLGPYARILAILVPLCLAILIQLACKNDSLHSRLHRLWRAVFKHFPTENHMRCATVGVSVINLEAAGWIVSSFLWSCLRWRWLFFGESSRNPALTMFSLAAGALFFAIHALGKLLRNRAPIADPAMFVRNSLNDCLHAIQCTNCIYLGLWLLCELASMYR